MKSWLPSDGYTRKEAATCASREISGTFFQLHEVVLDAGGRQDHAGTFASGLESELSRLEGNLCRAPARLKMVASPSPFPWPRQRSRYLPTAL